MPRYTAKHLGKIRTGAFKAMGGVIGEADPEFSAFMVEGASHLYAKLAVDNADWGALTPVQQAEGVRLALNAAVAAWIKTQARELGVNGEAEVLDCIPRAEPKVKY